MTAPQHVHDEVRRLLWAVRDAELSSDDAAKLRSLLSDPEARELYVWYSYLCGSLEWDYSARREELQTGIATRGLGTSVPSASVPSAVDPGPWTVGSEGPSTLGDHPSYFIPPPASVLPSTDHWPLAASQLAVGGVLFSYLTAALIVGVGLLVAAAWKLSNEPQIAHQSVPLRSPSSPLPSAVGRITGMVDCRWKESAVGSRQSAVGSGQDRAISKSPSLQISKSLVSLGDTFNLSSGLLEITYDTGAKVILQGPATYEVESRDGGYLSLGRLTARVEKGDGGRGTGGGETADRKSEIPNLQISKSPNPSSPVPRLPSPVPLFTVRTPTALVTDLGTEFGVEVAKSGETTSHVFRGSVRVQKLAADGTAEADSRIVGQHQTVRVESAAGNRRIVTLRTFTPSTFVRDIPKRSIRVFDLVDAVAGGDGFSNRRNRGIDVANGLATDKAQADKEPVAGDGKYHRVAASPFVDGVFLAGGRSGRVQLDSAGHVFDGFPERPSPSGFHVWAGGQLPVPTAFVGPTKDSADFSYRYEMDVLPSTQDLDGNGIPDMDIQQTSPGNIAVSGGGMTIVDGAKDLDYVGCESAGKLWQNRFASGDFTVEWSARILSTIGDETGQSGAFQLFAGNGHRSIVVLSGNQTKWEATPLLTADNMGSFHVYRLVRQGSSYYLWRDDALIGDGLVATGARGSMYFGDGGGYLNGSAAIDFVRLETGAYAPPTKSTGVALPGSPDGRHIRVASARLAGIDYSAGARGALWLHASQGITFDLEAIRRAHPGCRLLQFRAIAGVVDNDSTADHLADAWVFIDGRVAFRRRQINRYSGATPVVVAIGKSDHFLTLAAAGEGGDKPGRSWVVFGDPRIELSSSPP